MNEKNSSTEGFSAEGSSHQKQQTMSKRGAFKQQIQQYYSQLTVGCGHLNCTNSDCASNPNFEKLSSNDAAARAFVLYKNNANLCEKPPSKMARKDSKDDDLTSNSGFQTVASVTDGEMSSSCSDVVVEPDDNHDENSLTSHAMETSSSSAGDRLTNVDVGCECADNINAKLQNISVTEMSAQTLTKDAESSSCAANYEQHYDVLRKFEMNSLEEPNGLLSSIKQALWSVFSNSDCLNRFAIVKEDLKSQQILDEDKDVDETDVAYDPTTSVNNLKNVNDDDLVETLSGETSNTTQQLLQKDNAIRPSVNMQCIRKLYKHCESNAQLERVMLNAVSYLINDIDQQLTMKPDKYKHDLNYLNMFVILIENFALQSPEALGKAFPTFCKVLARLPIPAQAALSRFWAKFDEQHLRNIIESLQQLITFKVVSEVDTDEESTRLASTNEGIIAASRCMNIFFYASILGGKVNKEIDESGAAASMKLCENLKKEDGFNMGLPDESDVNFQFTWTDPLGKELNLNKLDCVKAIVPLHEFINEPLNEAIKIDKDYANYRKSQQIPSKFSFLHYPFLLNTLSKTTHLFYDNRVTMYSEWRRTVESSILRGMLVHPYLKIQVRRTHIIEDGLVQLELATENVKDLKKQLYVEFDGEEGVDEGGVSKEFFQLVVDKIFNPQYGMFTYNEETRLFWFNAHSFEVNTQYKLIGIVLGLAIYNNCILNINFPASVYRKLLGRKATFEDMLDSHPVLYKSLKQLLEYDGNVEDDMMITFQVEYQDVFGHTHKHDLMENGENIPVTEHNRQEYVNLYADWLLNTSISEQFNAFLSGFDIVVSDSPLKYLFHHNELELLIRGSENYDFDELEKSTEYDGGFTKDSQTIIDFWSVVHGMTESEKRNLLQFTTGSDRAPVGGLSKLKMIIARNGPDSSRLPTAHTCFNVILLPDYGNLEKMRERLLKAIKYSKGFGML